jgi:predicted TIM-barrel fold metal-dependent hydrolase
VQSNANIHLDLAYQAEPATTEFFVSEVGAGRVLYGSDAPFFEPAQVIASIEAAKITETEREQIFRGNAERLIDAVR